MSVSAAAYLDTSAALRAVLETGTTPELERRIQTAAVLLTSRLSHVEAARALLRLRQSGTVPVDALQTATREIEALWARCETWELTAAVCELACSVAPDRALRTLDALHLATFILARRELHDLELVTADKRLAEAAAAS